MNSDSSPAPHPQPPPPHHHHHQQQYHLIMNPNNPNNNNLNNNNLNNTNNNLNNTSSFPPTSPTQPISQQIPHSVAMPDLSGRFPYAPDGNVDLSNGSGFSIEQPKKKRGRPRKYSAEGGNTSISPTPISSSAGDPESVSKKNRGRPPGSGKKQLDALGAIGVGFTPHVITVKAGEDIASKITAFAQLGPRAICILSANGSICNVTLRQPAMSTGSVTYEGRFEIISLSGSFLPSENSRTGSLSVSLAGSDGRVLGGNVAGMLMAASPTQVIVGSFICDAKKTKTKIPSAPSPNILNFGAPVTDASPPSQGASSDSSEEGSDSPLNHGPGPYNNAGQPMQQSMSMYTNMSWPNPSIKTHPN